MQTDIFFVHLFNDFSGSPRVFRDAIAGLPSTNHKRLFTSNHSGFLSGLDVKYNYIFYVKTNNKIFQLFYYLLSQILLFFVLGFYVIKSKLRGNKVLVIINTMLPFGAGIASKLFGVTQLIFYVHESMINPPLLKHFLRYIIEITADKVIFVSNYLSVAEEFIKPTCSVIYNGLRGDFPLMPSIDHHRKHNNKQLLFAGSLKLYKGILELIDLAKALPDFHVVAAVNCTQDELDDFVNKYQTPTNMRYEIRPKNLDCLFMESFCVLNLSLPNAWIETFGLSLLEGMNYGCPVIAPAVGGPTEFVDSSNGVLINSQDIDGMTKILRNWENDFELWHSLSVSAQRRALEFTCEKFQTNFSDFISAVI